MTPQQDSLSGVIICPAQERGQRLTGVIQEIDANQEAQSGELLHHFVHYIVECAEVSMRRIRQAMRSELGMGYGGFQFLGVLSGVQCGVRRDERHINVGAYTTRRTVIASRIVKLPGHAMGESCGISGRPACAFCLLPIRQAQCGRCAPRRPQPAESSASAG